jgi:hypothetical protein
LTVEAVGTPEGNTLGPTSQCFGESHFLSR